MYITLLPSPVSVDKLVFLTRASVVSILNKIEELKSKSIVEEKKGEKKGLYFPSNCNLEVFLRDNALFGEAKRALKRIIDYYQNASENIVEAEIVNTAEIYHRIGFGDADFAFIKKAADIMARTGRAEKAAPFYDYCLHFLTDQPITSANAEDFLDCVLGRITLLIYHMSAQDEISLLRRAKEVAKRFKKHDRLARLENVMAQILQTSGEHRKASRSFNNFQRIVDSAQDPRLARSAVFVTCEFLFWKGRFTEVVEHYEKTIGGLEKFGDKEASLKAAALVGYCFVIRARISRGIGMIKAVRAKGEQMGFQQVIIFSDQMMTLSLFEIRRIAEAEPYLERLRGFSEDSLGYLISRAISDERAYILCLKGEYQDAFDCHQRGIMHAQSLGWKHHCGPWVFEYLDLLESKGYIDMEVNYESEINRLVKWDDLRMKGAAFRYRAQRNMEGSQSTRTILFDLRRSEKCLEASGAEIELARTRIVLGRYLLNQDKMAAQSYLEKAWTVLSRIDKDLFPQDLLSAMPEERKLEVMVERMIQINESVGTIRDRTPFLEKVIEVAMDFVMATRSAFLMLEQESGLKLAASRNLDPRFFESDQFHMVKDFLLDSGSKGNELVFPQRSDDDRQIDDKAFREAGIQSFIGMPARLAGQTYGYLWLDNRLGGGPFSHSQMPLVRFICNQIGIGLSNIDTYKEIRELKERFEEEAFFYKREMGITATIEMIVGKSKKMERVMNRIRQVAPTDTLVLILGETGVGKELVAKAVHNLSDRRDGPFIPVNLAAIPPELVASELFGHEKGAFTGAHKPRKGRLELADGGTIFLDEIGDLPSTDQVKLLRVLQEGTFEKLGSSEPTKSDFRVVVATNKDLRAEVLKGTFRQDLFYRLDVFPIHVPPLRERKEDIPELTWHFAEKFCRKLGGAHGKNSSTGDEEAQ